MTNGAIKPSYTVWTDSYYEITVPINTFVDPEHNKVFYTLKDKYAGIINTSYSTWHTYNRTLNGYPKSSGTVIYTLMGNDTAYLGVTTATFTVNVIDRPYLAPGIIMLLAAIASIIAIIASAVVVCTTSNLDIMTIPDLKGNDWIEYLKTQQQSPA